MSDQVFIIWRKRNHFFKVSDLNILNTSITCGGETEKCIDLYILPPPIKCRNRAMMRKLRLHNDKDSQMCPVSETLRRVLWQLSHVTSPTWGRDQQGSINTWWGEYPLPLGLTAESPLTRLTYGNLTWMYGESESRNVSEEMVYFRHSVSKQTSQGSALFK